MCDIATKESVIAQLEALIDKVSDGSVDTVLVTTGGINNHPVTRGYAVQHTMSYIGERADPRNHIVELALRAVRFATRLEPE